MKSKMERLKWLSPYFFLIILLVLLTVFFFRVKAYHLNSLEQLHISEKDPAIGSKNAPVNIIIFTKYPCGISGTFFKDIYPFLKSEYIEKGKVRLIYKSFYQDPSSPEIRGAEAAFCANEQGRFWEYNALLMEKEDEWLNRVVFDDTDVVNPVFEEYARNLSMNTNAFVNCLYQHKYQSKLREDYIRAVDELGVSKTPSFYINGLMIDGMPSLDDFKSLLLKFNYH